MSTNLVQQFQMLWESGDSPPDVFAFLGQHDGCDHATILSVLLVDQRFRWTTDRPLAVEEYLRRAVSLTNDLEFKRQLAVGEFRARQVQDKRPTIEEFTSRFADLGDSLQHELMKLVSSGEDATSGYGVAATKTYICDASLYDSHFGRYRLMRVLGEGAFGCVFLGFDAELQRHVAIKVPSADRFQKPEDANAYLKEARTVAGLDHPHIVPVHDVGRTDDGSIYVVSKFIEGSTLKDRIRNDRPSLDEAVKLLATVARALAHAHERRLIHRDVKPGNILLEDRTAAAYVADFGLAIREDDFLKESKVVGTPAYMSPEQVRGEGHRLDGRSDIFSLGVVIYELLTGKRPFVGSTANELFHQIVTADPRPPRELDESIPVELERICLKALSKRVSDRYATASALADDLEHWNQGPPQQQPELQIVPKGLRSFDAEDSEFFLTLLPGPRNRDGLPESIQFWKTRIEETDPDTTFRVGLIYGPSGCGKSSLIKAGLLPHLSEDVTAVYVGATPHETESRILRKLRKQRPKLPRETGLVETFAILRREEGRKVVVILDQFEQWLHAHRAEEENHLVDALRQCDGETLQAIIMVRDDFWLAASRFMNDIEVELVQGQNIRLVDLFDTDHAEKVLIKFGQAFGKLPARTSELSSEEQAFVHTVISGLAQDGKVVSVQLALFAEMVKGKPWKPATLDEVGGTAGIGINFLEESFCTRTANPIHRRHQHAAREVLGAMLPEVGSDIKGNMRLQEDILELSGYQHAPGRFNELLRILDGELRLITPADVGSIATDSGSSNDTRFYQLTHDYLVSPLREWLKRKQRETRKGRAELRLQERSALWSAKRESRQLPSLFEWIYIRAYTDSQRWSMAQKQMMNGASRRHFRRIVAVTCIVIVLGLTVEFYRRSITGRQRDFRAAGLVQRLLDTETERISEVLDDVIDDRKVAERHLRNALTQATETGDRRKELHVRLVLAHDDPVQIPPLIDFLKSAATPAEAKAIGAALAASNSDLVEELWRIFQEGESRSFRLPVGSVLLQLRRRDARWEASAATVANDITSTDLRHLADWYEAYRPLRNLLIPHLRSLFHQPGEQEVLARSRAAFGLATYLQETPLALIPLLEESEEKSQFEPILSQLRLVREKAIPEIYRRLRVLEVLGSATPADYQRAANLVVALLDFEARADIGRFLEHGVNPEFRSTLIDRLVLLGANPDALLHQLEDNPKADIRRALILSLGESGLQESDRGVRPRLLRVLHTLYRNDSDAGIHAAARWALRRLGESDTIHAVDESEQARSVSSAGWYTTAGGQTMSLIQGPRDFLMGVSSSRPEGDDAVHRRWIPRTFAISMENVTNAQYERFLKNYPTLRNSPVARFSPDEDGPRISTNWYLAAAYCRWLSEIENVPPDQMCFPAVPEIRDGMKLPANLLERTGYRLPTEAEWECACRAGATTLRYYGESDELLPRYAWFLENSQNHCWRVGTLKPNDFGMFDMHGNVWEWCLNVYRPYPVGAPDAVVDELQDIDLHDSTQPRVLRGGSYGNKAFDITSSRRNGFSPNSATAVIGFRIARTVTSDSDSARKE